MPADPLRLSPEMQVQVARWLQGLRERLIAQQMDSLLAVRQPWPHSEGTEWPGTYGYRDAWLTRTLAGIPGAR